MKDFDFVKTAIEEAKAVTDEMTGSGEFDAEKLKKELLGLDVFKEINEYLQSRENLKACEPFDVLDRKFVDLYLQYRDAYSDLYRGIEEKAYKREYASGGTEHRGYYCPGRLLEVNGGCRRGRLLKRTPNKGKRAFEYLFDEDGRMICVYEHKEFGTEKPPISTELFVWEGDLVRSFVFEIRKWKKLPELQWICECRYENGKIVRYEYALCGCLSFADKKEHCDRLHIETFEYENDFMKALHWYRYIPDTHILNDTKFYYKRDEDGNPVYDFCEEIDGFRNWKEQRASDDAQKNTQKEENQ